MKRPPKSAFPPPPDDRIIHVYLRREGEAAGESRLTFEGSLRADLWSTPTMTDEDYCEAVLSLLTLPLEELTGWERTVRHAWDHDGSTFRVGDAIVFEDGAHRYGYLCQPVGWSPLVGRGGRGSQAQDLEDIS